MKLPSAFLTLSALVALAAASAASAVPDSPATTTARASGPPTRAQIAAPAPIQALPAQPQVHRFPVNAAKGLIGHAVNTAALIETVAVLIQLRDGFVHPNIGLHDPVRPLPYAGDAAVPRPVRRALKTAFGFGGFNAALILEAA